MIALGEDMIPPAGCEEEGSMARCFVAAGFSDEINARLAALQAKARALGLDATFPREFHCTLAFLGNLSDEEVKEAKRKLDSIKAHPTAVSVEGTGFFPSEKFVKVFWVGVRGLEGLQAGVAEALGYGEKFEGHVTLARVKTQRNLGLLKKLAAESKSGEFGKTAVGEIVLYESKLTPQGPVYEPLFAKKLS